MSAHTNPPRTDLAPVSVRIGDRSYRVAASAATLVEAFVAEHSEPEKDAGSDAVAFARQTLCAAPGGAAAAHLRKLRWQRQMSQRDLARAVGTTPGHVCDIEKGRRPIGTKLAKRLASALGAVYWLDLLSD